MNLSLSASPAVTPCNDCFVAISEFVVASCLVSDVNDDCVSVFSAVALFVLSLFDGCGVVSSFLGASCGLSATLALSFDCVISAVLVAAVVVLLLSGVEQVTY
jgi:hypothetical protein